MKTKRVILGGVLLVALLGIVAALAEDGVRWRGRLAFMKLTGELPEISWAELARMLNPRGPYYIEEVVLRGSGFAGGAESVHDRGGCERGTPGLRHALLLLPWG